MADEEVKIGPTGQNEEFNKAFKSKESYVYKIRSSGDEKTTLNDFLEKSNMSVSANDDSTSDEVRTRKEGLELKDYSTTYAADDTKANDNKIDGGTQTIGTETLENNLIDGGVENLTTETLSDGSFFDSFGKSLGRTAITSIPGFSAVADVVNKFVEKEPAGLFKAEVGIDSAKEKAANKKEVTVVQSLQLNDNIGFPVGTIDSNRYGSMHKDSAVARLQSAKEGSSILKKLGIDLLSSTINLGNLLGDRSIGAEIDFWTPDDKALNELNSKELYELQSVTVGSIYDEKPGKYIQPMSGNEEHKKQYLSKILQYKGDNNGKTYAEDRFDNDSIGHIYVEPYYSNDKGVECFSIPFQFNAEISEGGIRAEYSTEKLLGRITDARYYIGTNSDTVTIKTTYIATNMWESKHVIENQYGEIIDRMDYTDLDGAWYKYWTISRLAEIELKYRSLVFPMRDSDGYLTKPPIVQVYIGSKKYSENPTVRNVLSYPIDYNIAKNGSSYDFTHTINFSDSRKKEDLVGGYSNVKRYIVTDVKIEDLEGTNGWNYNGVNDWESNTSYSSQFLKGKRGFTVTLTLAETTRNFLDKIPDFKAYYDSFIKYNKLSEYWKSSENTKSGFQRVMEEKLNKLSSDIITKEGEATSLEAQKTSLGKTMMDKEGTYNQTKGDYEEANSELGKALRELEEAQRSGDANLISEKQQNYATARENYDNCYGAYVTAKEEYKLAKKKYDNKVKEIKNKEKDIKSLQKLEEATKTNPTIGIMESL